MIFSYQTLCMETVKQKHIEMIRCWRNSQSIKKTMLFQQHITQNQQAEWFKLISKENQLFFLCYDKGEVIGVVYANKIDWDQKISFNSGIFIVKEDLYGTGLPIQLSLLFTQCGFAFGINENRILIRNDNSNAIKFNESIGYTCMEQLGNHAYYRLTKSAFDNKLGKLPKALSIVPPVGLIWEDTPSDLFLKAQIKKDFSVLPPFFKIIPAGQTGQ